MRVAVDARSLYQERTLRGVGQCLLGLYRTLASIRPTWSFDMYFQTTNGSDPLSDRPNVTVRPIDRPGDRFSAWQHVWFPLEARRSGADILHAPGAIAPRFPLSTMVTTIHDLTPLEFAPEDPAVQQWGRNVARGAHRARRVLVPSEHTRNEVVRVLRVPDSKIEVVRWGANPAMRKAADLQLVTRYGLRPGQPFLMHFGMALPRKNTQRVFAAWAGLPPEVRRDSRLLVVGLEGQSLRDFGGLVDQLGMADSVRLHGYVPQADIPFLLSAAAGLCYVPLSEGFGLPILDAFACDTPVLASRVTSIPEVTGEAALLVEPTDVAALGLAMRRLLTDAALRDQLRAKGRDQLERFSWDSCAERVADIFERIA